MRNLFSKGLMAAAAVMMFASCSNEEGFVNPNEGKTSEVTIAMSVKGSKAAPGDVNMDGDNTPAKIENVVLVPMIDDAYQTPILYGDFDSSLAPDKRVKRTLPQTVNRFKVYGNPTKNNAKENVVFTPDALTFSVGAQVDDVEEITAYAPHGLYYYAYFDSSRPFQVATGDAWPSDWTNVLETGIGTNNYVNLPGVKYAVGVLAAAVRNGDTNKTTFYDSADDRAGEQNGHNWKETDVVVSGIVVFDQARTFDDALVAQSKDKVNVYTNAFAQTVKADSEENKIDNDKRANGNLYCVVAPTTDNTVSLNIEFTANSYFKLADGTEVNPNEKIYFPVTLDKTIVTGPSDQIFKAAVATFLNAKVMNWGLGSKTPVESTDVTIGVEFDASWAPGLNFDVEI